jgi:hypothetical protein
MVPVPVTLAMRGGVAQACRSQESSSTRTARRRKNHEAARLNRDGLSCRPAGGAISRTSKDSGIVHAQDKGRTMRQTRPTGQT